MTKTRVVHCRRESYDIYIGRPSKWGNPFKLKKTDDRAILMEQYRQWLLQQPQILADIHELQGKTLGCWCKPELCHGDILAELADEVDCQPQPSKKRKKRKVG